MVRKMTGSKMKEDSRLMRERNTKQYGLFAVSLIFILFIMAIASAMTIRNVATSPTEIAPGGTAIISIEIENTLSDDATNVNVVLDLSGTVPIAPYLGSAEKSIDEIKHGDEEKFTFNVIVLPEATPGVYKIPVKISYDANGTRQTKNGTIGIIVNSPPQLKISADGYLIKGQEGKIEVKIVNDGLSDLKFVSIQATQPFSGATINSPLYEYLGNINSDDFGTVEYTIFARENSGLLLSIPVQINYKDATNKDFSQEETLTVKVYSIDDAKNLGLIPAQGYTLYVIIGIALILYAGYRIRKKMKRKKALGA